MALPPYDQVQKFPSADQMIEHVEKLCKKVRKRPPAPSFHTNGSPSKSKCPYFPSFCVQVHLQIVDIFDNPDVVMAKFVQSLLERVLQVSLHKDTPLQVTGRGLYANHL